MYIAENLKTLRKKKDMTQEEVAERLRVSAQSVSKWERGDTFPDITMLPALANFYSTSIDALIGMDRINDVQTKNAIFTTEHEHLRNGDYSSAAAVLTEGLNTFPNDEGLMSELAMALALDGGPDKLTQAISLCERVLSGHQSEKVHHTTRAALSFIYMKAGDKEKAVSVAKNLPHIRESRETILAEFNKTQSMDDIDSYLRFIALGENDEQDIINVDFGIDIVPAVLGCNLRGQIESLQNEIGNNKLPRIRIRDNSSLAPNQVRVRHYADFLIDTTFTDHAGAIVQIITVLRRIAKD